MTRNTERNFWLDVAIFAGFLITTVTGVVLWRIIRHTVDAGFSGLLRPVWMAAHVGAGVLCLSGVVLHIVWHRDWLRVLRGRSLREMPKKLRANRVVDRAMWVCFIATIACGALAATLHLGSARDAVGIPGRLHVAFGSAWTVLTIAHLGLHRKWIAATARRCLAIGRPRAAVLHPEGGP